MTKNDGKVMINNGFKCNDVYLIRIKAIYCINKFIKETIPPRNTATQNYF